MGGLFGKPHQNEFIGKSKSATQQVRRAAAHNYARRVYERGGSEKRRRAGKRLGAVTAGLLGSGPLSCVLPLASPYAFGLRRLSRRRCW